MTTGGQVSKVIAQVATDDKRGTGLTGLRVTTEGQVSQLLQVTTGGQVSQGITGGKDSQVVAYILVGFYR